MPSPPTPNVDPLRNGWFRRIYSGFLEGERINGVSIEAEAAFWRFHSIADDYGNFSAQPLLLRTKAFPMRDVTVESVSGWFAELVDSGLLISYESGGKPYAAVSGFEAMQPAPRNGRRVQRHPRPPKEPEASAGEAGLPLGDTCNDPGEPWGNRGSPGEPGGYQDQDQDHDQDQRDISGVRKTRGEFEEAMARRIFAAYPRRTGGRVKPIEEIHLAAVRIAVNPDHEGKDDPYAWLEERTIAYSRSEHAKPAPRGSADFRMKAANWFKSDGYDDPEEEWAKRSFNTQRDDPHERRAAQASREHISGLTGADIPTI